MLFRKIFVGIFRKELQAEMKIGQLVYVIQDSWAFKARIVNFDEETFCVQIVFPHTDELLFVDKVFVSHEDAEKELKNDA